MNASELFARAHGKQCHGAEQCHWCGSPCDQLHHHDNRDTLGPVIRNANPRMDLLPNTTAKNINSKWICQGCYLFRRPRMTVFFNDGGYMDSQAPTRHSWLLTDSDAKAVKPGDVGIYDTLLNPPKVFALMLLSPPEKNQPQRNEHHIHLAPVNETNWKKSDSELRFTLDSQEYIYTTGELLALLSDGKPSGKSGGVRLLVEHFGTTSKYRKTTKGRPKSHAGDALPMSEFAAGTVTDVPLRSGC